MKKVVLFLSFVMCVSFLGAQNNYNLKKNPVKNGQRTGKTIKTTKPVKYVRNTKDVIPDGYVRITLTADDVWGDGSGYQLLIDSNATAYGTIIPQAGAIPASGVVGDSVFGDVADSAYAKFEWKLPVNADGSLSTTNMLCGASASIDIPAGTYDYCVTNPTPGDRMWITGNGRGDDSVFVAGNEYVFHVMAYGTGDYVLLTVLTPTPDVAFAGAYGSTNVNIGNNDTITAYFQNLSVNAMYNVPIVCNVTDPTNNATTLNETIDTLLPAESKSVQFVINYTLEGTYTLNIFSNLATDGNHANDSMSASISALPAASLSYDFNNGEWPANWLTYNLDGNTINSNISDMFPENAGWELVQADQDGEQFLAGAASWFDPSGTADRWLCTGPISLYSHNYLQFEAKSQDPNYLESLEVLISPTGSRQTSDYTQTLLTLDEVGNNNGGMVTYSANLQNWEQDTISIAFHLNSTDAFICYLDNVKILGQATEITPSSLRGVESASAFAIYPNPAKDFVTISNANGATIKVIDIMGRVVMSQNSNTPNFKLSIQDLQNGVYMLQVTNGAKTSTQKLIKK